MLHSWAEEGVEDDAGGDGGWGGDGYEDDDYGGDAGADGYNAGGVNALTG